MTNALISSPQFALPAELDGWVVVKASPEAQGMGRDKAGYVVWLEKVMSDGTTLRFEALIHDPERELQMLVPVIQAVTALSAPDVRISVTRGKSTRFDIGRGRYNRRLTR